MKTFMQYLEDAVPGGPPPGGPPPGAAPPGGPPMGGGPPPMGGPPMGGGPPPMGGMGGPGAPGGGQAPMKLKSTNVWDVLEKYLNADSQPTKASS